MSIFLTAASIQQFDDMVKHAPQGMGMLQPHFRTKTGVVGDAYKFPKMGKGMATARIPQTDVVPMNIAHSRVSAALTDWNAPEYTDVFDQATNNVQEQKELAFVISGALGRRKDQLILDALDAASTSLTVSDDIGGSSTNLNTAKFRKAKQLLDKGGVSKTDRKAIIHANNVYGLLGDSDASTVDKNAVKMLVDGEITKWLGFESLVMEDRDEGGLPIATSIRTTYFCHGGQMGCLGLAIGIDQRTEVNYIAEKTSWLANGLLKAGAVAIDATEIVEVSCNETGI
jgi:hypothetical protein